MKLLADIPSGSELLLHICCAPDAAYGAVAGLFAFAAVILAAPMDSPLLFRSGSLLIGLGGGLFSVGTLTAAMGLDRGDHAGLALGAWGAV